MSAIDEQEAENSKKCEITQNSGSHRRLKFPKKLKKSDSTTWQTDYPDTWQL